MQPFSVAPLFIFDFLRSKTPRLVESSIVVALLEQQLGIFSGRSKCTSQTMQSSFRRSPPPHLTTRSFCVDNRIVPPLNQLDSCLPVLSRHPPLFLSIVADLRHLLAELAPATTVSSLSVSLDPTGKFCELICLWIPLVFFLRLRSWLKENRCTMFKVRHRAVGSPVSVWHTGRAGTTPGVAWHIEILSNDVGPSPSRGQPS